MERTDGRKEDEIRKVSIEKNPIGNSAGSALVSFGKTKVLCTANITDSVPQFLENSGSGWITAEYSMLPGSTKERNQRESTKGKIGGRTHEIQRIIGRSLRSALNMGAIAGKTIWIDCDVLEADGGTRTASITGGYVALWLALEKFKETANCKKKILKGYVAGISVGIVNGTPVIDLNYEEDKNCEVDMNFVMMDSGKFIEIQGTAEHKPFAYDQLLAMTDLAKKGIEEIIALQKRMCEG